MLHLIYKDYITSYLTLNLSKILKIIELNTSGMLKSLMHVGKLKHLNNLSNTLEPKRVIIFGLILSQINSLKFFYINKLSACIETDSIV